jgi:hypothetical protein
MSYFFSGMAGAEEADALAQQAHEAHEAGRYLEAARLLEQAAGEDPERSAQFVALRAQDLAMGGRCPEAQALISQLRSSRAPGVESYERIVNEACSSERQLQPMPDFSEPTEIPQEVVESAPSFWQRLLGQTPSMPQVEVGLPTVVPPSGAGWGTTPAPGWPMPGEPSVPSTSAPGKPGVETTTAQAPWMPSAPSVVEGGFATLEAKAREIGQFFSSAAQRVAGDTVSQEARNGATLAPSARAAQPPPMPGEEPSWAARYAPYLIGFGVSAVAIGIVAYLVLAPEEEEEEVTP